MSATDINFQILNVKDQLLKISSPNFEEMYLRFGQEVCMGFV